jgi:fimbrial isopeptide formation D2 family protein
LTKSNAHDGKNIAVITFDMVLPYDGSAKSAVAVPEFIQTNAVEIVNYSSSNENKLNRALASPASASTTVKTAAVVLTTQVVSTSEDPTGAESGALKIGEIVTYEVTVVLPGGTLGSVDIADVLPSGLSYVANSASITAQGSAVTATPTLTVNDGTIDFNLGNVAVGNDLRDATGTFIFRLTGVVTAAAGVSDGQSLDNVATISFVDPNLGSRTSVTADAAVVMAVPSLRLTDEVENLSSEAPSFGSGVTVNAGDTIEYRLHLTNTGTGNAFQVEVKDLLNEWDHMMLLWEEDTCSVLLAGAFTELGIVTLPFNPTAENMAEDIAGRILANFPTVEFVGVQLWETPKACAASSMHRLPA